MSFDDWVEESRQRVRHDGLRNGTYAALQELWAGVLGRAGQVWNYGDHVLDAEWDVLLVFDACRVDLMRAVARTGEYDVLDRFDAKKHTRNSVASRSPEWVAKTFDFGQYGDELANLAYVTANPHSQDIDTPDRLAVFDEVWRYGWDHDIGVTPPRAVTDRLIDTARQTESNRIVAHYMQPHLPFRSLVNDHPEWFKFDPGTEADDTAEFKTLWRRLRDGEVDRDTVWEAYVDNLKWVMDEVALLRENLDADQVVITADHANAMGEWWCYGHTTTAPIPAMKRVPWVEFSAVDEHSYEPSLEAEYTSLSQAETESRLTALGYV
jgi:hypothetical protein